MNSKYLPSKHWLQTNWYWQWIEEPGNNNNIIISEIAVNVKTRS